MQQFFHKRRVEPVNSLRVNGFKQVPFTGQENSSALNGFQTGEHVWTEKLDYDPNLALNMTT